MIKIKSENSDKQIKASKSCESGGGIKMLILMTCIVIVGILGGGYYVSVSAVTGIVLTGVLFYRMYVKKRITAAWDLNMAAFAVLVFGYLLSVVIVLRTCIGSDGRKRENDRVSSDAWMSYDCFFICYDAV